MRAATLLNSKRHRAIGMNVVTSNRERRMRVTKITPMKAIRAKCIDCSCGEKKEVRLCPIEWCPLWPYRMGKRPAKDANIDEKN